MILWKSISKIGNIDWSRVVWPPWLWRSSSSTVSWPKPIPASCETLPLSLLFGRRNLLSFSKKSMNSFASDPIWSTENWQFWWRGNFNAWIYRRPRTSTHPKLAFNVQEECLGFEVHLGSWVDNTPRFERLSHHQPPWEFSRTAGQLSNASSCPTFAFQLATIS